ncbi:MAG: hypothetical protein ACI8TP_002626 [Acidimicrobiales bacterium]
MNAEPYLLWRRDTTRTSRKWLKWVALVLVPLCAFGAFAGYMADDLDSFVTTAGLGVIAMGLCALIPVVRDFQNLSIGVATFAMKDGSETKFTWPSLDEPELDFLAGRLEQVLPGRRDLSSLS